jgi:hypothetical protein
MGPFSACREAKEPRAKTSESVCFMVVGKVGRHENVDQGGFMSFWSHDQKHDLHGIKKKAPPAGGAFP